jgi:hypothetical protein
MAKIGDIVGAVTKASKETIAASWALKIKLSGGL